MSSIFFNNKRIARQNLMDVVNIYIKGRLYHRSFRCSNHYFVIGIIKRRPYARRVAHHKSIAMPQHSCQRITPIPIFGCFVQYLLNVQFFCYQRRNIHLRKPLRLKQLIQIFVFLIQKMPYFFKYGNRIRCFHRMLPQCNQSLKQFVHIGQIKIACQHQIFCLPVIMTDKRMQILQIIFAKSAITQMPQIQFANKISIIFQPRHIV